MILYRSANHHECPYKQRFLLTGSRNTTPKRRHQNRLYFWNEERRRTMLLSIPCGDSVLRWCVMTAGGLWDVIIPALVFSVRWNEVCLGLISPLSIPTPWVRNGFGSFLFVWTQLWTVVSTDVVHVECSSPQNNSFHHPL